MIQRDTQMRKGRGNTNNLVRDMMEAVMGNHVSRGEYTETYQYRISPLSRTTKTCGADYQSVGEMASMRYAENLLRFKTDGPMGNV